MADPRITYGWSSRRAGVVIRTTGSDPSELAPSQTPEAKHTLHVSPIWARQDNRRLDNQTKSQVGSFRDLA